MMMKVKQKRVILTQRDRCLLQFLFESKVCTFEQIRRNIFLNISCSIVRRRLKGLIESKYVSISTNFVNPQGRLSYSVTDKGIEVFAQDIPFVIDRKIKKSDSIHHDLALVDIIYKLKEFKYVEELFTENALQCYQDLREGIPYRDYAALRSDGFIEMMFKDKKLLAALEYDKTSKNSKRYFQKFKDYYYNEDITGILYICENKPMMNKLLSIDQKVCNQEDSKFFFCLKDELLLSKEKVTLVNFKGQKFELV